MGVRNDVFTMAFNFGHGYAFYLFIYLTDTVNRRITSTKNQFIYLNIYFKR